MPEGQSDALFRLLADYLGAALQTTTDPSLKDVRLGHKPAGRPWTTHRGKVEVLKAVASNSKKGRELLGSDEAARAEVRPTAPAISAGAAQRVAPDLDICCDVQSPACWGRRPAWGDCPLPCRCPCMKRRCSEYLLSQGVSQSPAISLPLLSAF